MTNVLEKAVEKFDEQGHPGVAEASAAKRVNRARATGVVIKSIVGLTGVAVALGGFRQGGLDGAVEAVWEGLTSPLRNAEGNWDMPIIDINEPDVEVVFTRDASVNQEQNISEELIACPTDVKKVNLLGGYVSSAVYDANASFLGDLNGNELALDPLWINYFAQDNGGMNPDSPTSQDVQIRILESIQNCEIR